MEEKPNETKEEEYLKYRDKLIDSLLSNSKQVYYDEYKNLNESERYTVKHLTDNEYFKKIKYDIPEKDLPIIIQLKILQKLNRMHDDQKTIKGIMIFWLVLTIIGLIGVLYLCSKIGTTYSNL